MQKNLKKRGLSTAVGDEGGFAPKFEGIKDALDSIMQAITDAGYEPGKDVKIAMDCAASEFATLEDGKWYYDYSKLKNGMPKDPNGKKLTADEQIAYLEELITEYPIDSIEDGLDENDWDNWVKLTKKIGDRCQLVGDDLFVTNVKFLEKGIKMGAANSILIKVNQIGSLTETLEAIEMAHRAALAKLKIQLLLISLLLQTLDRLRQVQCLVLIVWLSTINLSALTKSSIALHVTVTRKSSKFFFHYNNKETACLFCLLIFVI